MTSLAVFDWNGTLLADTRQIFAADNEVIKALGIKEVTYQEFLDTFDIPVKDYYMKLGASKLQLLRKAMKLERIFHTSYAKRVLKVRTRAHTKDILEFLKSKNIPMVILSNHVREEIIKELNRRNLQKYFAEILGNSMINTAFQSRSKQDKLSAYLKQNRIDPKRILIVGDGTEEIHIARSLGAKVVSITHGNYSTRRLKAAKPDYLITNLLEIKKIVAKTV